MKVPLPLSSCLPTCSIALAALFLLLPMASPAAGLQPPDACGAARFDGSQTKLMVGGDGIIAGTFTVEMWVKPDDLAGGRGLLGSRFTPNEYGFDLKLNGGSQVQADIGNGSGWAVSPAIAEFNYQTDSWVYVAYVVTPTNYTIYANGKRVGGGQYPLITPLLRDAAHHLYIGWTGFGSEFFKGEIAEVRLWNHALTARRIGNIWQRPLRLPQPGLILCYRFTEGAGDTVHDLSGNGNHGTVVNGIGWSRPSLPADAVSAVLTFPEVRYAAKLSDDEARFHLNVQAEATAAGSATLFEGDVALLPAKLPDSLKIVREGNRYRLVAARAGHFKFDLDLVAKIQRADPWNQISFTGPAATIGAITAAVAGADTEVQLLEGTVLESARTNDAVQLTGFLGADRTVALRWQSKIAQVAHKALLTVDSTISAQVTPTVIKYTSRFHYDIVQGSAPELTLTLPAAQALTHLDGAQIRDWHLAVDGTHQTLTVAFIKPVENSYDLTVSTEQSVDAPDTRTVLDPPQPQNVERESGSLTLAAEDELVDISAPAGLHQVNAPDNAVAAYEFNARPLTLALALKPIEPVVNVADRVSAQLEETRLTVSHRLSLDVAKAGIYTLELAPPEGFAVADVRGDGIEDWNVSGGKIRVNFTARILGARELTVQLEQALKNFPDNIAIAPLRVTGAAKATAQIGAASAPGIQLRTAQLNGLREIPASRLANRSNEILAYTADQPDWSLSIASEKLPPRIVADVFNLVTIGDGIVGGSATIRYGLVGQGVQEFKIAVPANFKNVDFTGPNIRNKEFADGVWTISLQDKVWGGYTLVVTYDYPFDAKSATLPVAGIHAVNAERESGSIAITTAASLQLNPAKVSDSLRRVDESELSAADRSFISRAVVLAYQYTAESYELTVDARRYAEESVLDAVADRTQITSVLTDAGEMLTQASFMVKNNEKQFQRFELPAGATLWGCYVNGQPAKAERDGAWVLVPLPRDADRDQASGVDILYAQTNGVASTLWGKSLALNAPRTDVPSTYAEWQLFVPPAYRLSHFGGSMAVAQGTTYELLDAWEKFLAFYIQVLHEAGGAILVIGLLAALVTALVIASARRGWNGVITLLVVTAILAVLAAMMLPALSAAKRKAQRINSVSNLNQIGLALKIFAGDNNNRLPMSFNELTNEISSTRVLADPETGLPYVYLGAGLSLDDLKPESVLAYGTGQKGNCNVLFADGTVQQFTAGKFQELVQRGLVQVAAPQDVAEAQRLAISRGQLATPPPAAATPATVSAGYADQITASQPPATATPAAPVMVAGIHSLHIDLPRTGQPFLFTKVLNIRDEPLSIRAQVMSLRTFQNLQMTWQTIAFLLGLAVWWMQWRSERRNSFILTVALSLVLGSVCSLLVEHRALHDVLIIGFPIAVLAALLAGIWKFWRRRHLDDSEPPVEPPVPPPAAPPVPPVTPIPTALAAVILFLVFSIAGTHAATPTEPVPASIVTADYSGTVNDRVALLDVSLQISSSAPGQVVPLFGGDVAAQSFEVKDGKAELVRNGQALAVRLESRGKIILQLKMLAKISGDVTKRRLSLAIPAALSSRVALTLAETDADVDFPDAISARRTLEKNQTRIVALLGPADRIELLWTPRVKRADEIAATVFCQNNSLATVGNGVVNIRSALDYQVTQGELRRARVQLPAGEKVLRVDGKEIRTWEIKSENGAPVLVVDLLKGITESWRLTIEGEKTLGALPATEAIAVPHALDVKRETGLVALRGAGEVALTVDSAAGLQRVDAEEFPRPASDKSTALFSVYQFSRSEFSLKIHAEAVQPELEAVVRNNFRVSTEQITLSAAVDYTIKRAGIFSLKLALPEGYRLDSVSGDKIQQQNQRDENGASILELTLKERVAGNYGLRLELSRDVKELPKSIALAGVHPVGAAKLTGYLSVVGDPGVAVKTGSLDGLTEIPAVALPDYNALAGAGSVLAYKFISPEPKAVTWKLTVATESVAAWVRAEIVDTFTLSETLVSGHALVRYDIANAPVKEFRLRMPEGFQNVEIVGANIRSREQNGRVWRVELQSPARGSYRLNVTWEQPRSSRTNRLELDGVSTENVERETGILAVAAKGTLQVSEVAATDLQRIDPADFPDWAGAPDAATALAYRYVRPGYQLVLDARRFDEASVLQALIDSATFTSVVADDGQMMTEMSLSLRNNGRQFLQVELPPGVGSNGVWSAFVADQAVRPSLRDGKLLLPIQQSGADDAQVQVQLTYVGTNRFPHARGEVHFISPKFDVPVKNARWEVYLPPGYDYKNFAGTMGRETLSAPAYGTSLFSSLEYSRMEQANKSEAIVEAQRDVSDARRQLAQGRVREANASFYRAKKMEGNVDKDEVMQLQKELQTAQASNLIAAQNAWSARNGVVAGSGGTGGGGGGRGGIDQPMSWQYDNADAEQQLVKLQQAQELVATRIQPLHVNLPVRGLRLSFTQVLQTESDKAMTIDLFAANTKAIHWPSRLLTMAAAFLALWIAVAILSFLTTRPKEA